MTADVDNKLDRFRHFLFARVDASSLAIFRIGFGALLLFNAINSIALCLACYYLEPAFLFKYHYFEWIRPWPSGWLLNLHWLLLAVCATAITIGYRYRLALIVYSIGFSYGFLLDEALYLNHYYMVMLFCAVMLFLPANCLWSADAARNKLIHRLTIARWCLLLPVLQLEIILLHAGFAKLNMDWLSLEPLRMWMHAIRPDMPAFFTAITSDFGIAMGAYGAIALHLLGAPLLFFRRTRLWVLLVYAVFHVINHIVFNIGIFPWFTLFASFLFLDPDWPRQLYARFKGKPGVSASGFGGQQLTSNNVALSGARERRYHQWLIIGLAGIWLLTQTLIPLRHWFYSGDVAWNEDGHRFAWRMKLRSKSGRPVFIVRSAGKHWQVHPIDYLSPKQTRKMACIPDMLWQFAGFLEREWQKRGHSGINVTVSAYCSLNGRDMQLLIDPSIDLTTVPRSPAKPYVVALTKSLRKATAE